MQISHDPGDDGASGDLPALSRLPRQDAIALGATLDRSRTRCSTGVGATRPPGDRVRLQLPDHRSCGALPHTRNCPAVAASQALADHACGTTRPAVLLRGRATGGRHRPAAPRRDGGVLAGAAVEIVAHSSQGPCAHPRDHRRARGGEADPPPGPGLRSLRRGPRASGHAAALRPGPFVAESAATGRQGRRTLHHSPPRGPRPRHRPPPSPPRSSPWAGREDHGHALRHALAGLKRTVLDVECAFRHGARNGRGVSENLGVVAVHNAETGDWRLARLRHQRPHPRPGRRARCADVPPPPGRSSSSSSSASQARVCMRCPASARRSCAPSSALPSVEPQSAYEVDDRSRPSSGEVEPTTSTRSLGRGSGCFTRTLRFDCTCRHPHAHSPTASAPLGRGQPQALVHTLVVCGGCVTATTTALSAYPIKDAARAGRESWRMRTWRPAG